MSLPKTIPLTETVELMDSASLVLDEKTAELTLASLRPVLPGRIAIVGNYLPRHCGIATFTTDLCDAIHLEYGAAELLALPVNDTEEGYTYPARVRFELRWISPASISPSTVHLSNSSGCIQIPAKAARKE